MTNVDHLMIFLLFVVQPVHGAWAWARYVAGIRAGEPPDRLRQYRATCILEWTAFAVLAIVWLYLERPPAALGLVAPSGTGFWLGVALLVAATGYLYRAWRQARRSSSEDRTKVVESLGDLRHFLPHTRREYVSIVGLSITAGIVEEIIYRGFVFWYLVQYMPMWAVVIVSAIAFGLGHSYQGIVGVRRVMLIGLAFGAYYLLTGSIWLPIAAHIMLDILQCGTIYECLRDRAGEVPRAVRSGAGSAEADRR